MGTYSEYIKEIENLFRDFNFIKCILRRINDIATRESWNKTAFDNTLFVNVQVKVNGYHAKSLESDISWDSQENIPFKQIRLSVDYVEATDYDDSLIFKVYRQEKKEAQDNREFWDQKSPRISLVEACDKNSLKVMSPTATTTIPLSVYSSTISNDYVESPRKRISDAIITCAKAALIDND